MVMAAFLIVLAAIIARRKKPLWLKPHKKAAMAGVLSALLAFVIIFIFKVSLQFPHFQSPHSIIGIITLVLLIVTPVTGFMMPKGPKSFRPAHKVLGRITSIVILLTALSGVMRWVQILKK